MHIIKIYTCHRYIKPKYGKWLVKLAFPHIVGIKDKLVQPIWKLIWILYVYDTLTIVFPQR